MIALCYFFMTATLLENYWMDFHDTLVYIITKLNERKCSTKEVA